MEGLIYQIGIGLIPKIGDITAKKLIAYCGGVDAVFKENKAALRKIPGISNSILNEIANLISKNEFQISTSAVL